MPTPLSFAACLLLAASAEAFAQPPADPLSPNPLSTDPWTICKGVDPKAAIPACTTLLQSQQDVEKLAATYTARGNAYTAQRQYQPAIDDFTQAIRLNPHSADAFYSRGDARLITGQLTLSIADFTQAIQLRPSFPEAYNDRGIALHTQGDDTKAIADFDHAIELLPKYPEMYASRCLSRALAGDLRPAVSDCDYALSLRPGVASTYQSRALAFLKMKNYPAAIADYTAALNLTPNKPDPISLYGRGLARQSTGDTASAKADIDQAIKFQPGVADLFTRWGVPPPEDPATP